MYIPWVEIFIVMTHVALIERIAIGKHCKSTLPVVINIVYK